MTWRTRSESLALALALVCTLAAAGSARSARADEPPDRVPTLAPALDVAPAPAAAAAPAPAPAPPADAPPAHAPPLAAAATIVAPASVEAPGDGERPVADEGGEDEVSAQQSVDAFTELEDAQAGRPGAFEERLWLAWGYVPAEGNIPNDTLELSYTGEGMFKNTELDLAQYFEHDDVDNSTAFIFGWMQRWVKDGGRDSVVPSVGTLTEYYLRTPFLIDLPDFAPGATVGDHIAEIVTIAKYAGPGTLYVNAEAQMQLFNSQICVTEDDVAIQPRDGPDQNGPVRPNFDGCDYWSPFTLAARIGYKLPMVEDRLAFIADLTIETNEFATQEASATLPEPEPHFPYVWANLAVLWHVSENWTVSPGILIGLDGREETPTYEAGLFVLHE